MPDQVTDKLICIIYLSIEKDALLIAVCFLFQFSKYLINLLVCFQLFIFYSVKSLKNLSIGQHKTAHRDERLDYSHADTHSRRTMKNGREHSHPRLRKCIWES